MKPRFPLAVALSGGSARGFAHLGVMKAFQEAGVKPDLLAGTSAGALIAAFWAAGREANDLITLTKKLRWTDLARPQFPKEKLFSPQPFKNFLYKNLGGGRFSALTIPLAVVAVDFEKAEKVVFMEGALAPALIASCAIPGILGPVKWQGKLLVDGGILENLPIATCFEKGAGQVIGVDLLWRQWERFVPDDVTSVFFRALTIMAANQIPDHHWGDKALIIKPDLSPYGPLSMSAREEMIEVGYWSTIKALESAGKPSDFPEKS